MTTATKATEATEDAKLPEKRVFAEARGRYTLIDSQKAFHFDFPSTSTLEDNLAAISFLRNEVIKAITLVKEEEEKKLKTDTQEKCEKCKEEKE